MTSVLTPKSLVTHSFATSAFANVHPKITSIGRQIVQNWVAGESIKLSEYPDDAYPDQVFASWSALIKRVYMLDNSRRLITSKPSKKLLGEVGMDRGGWVDYHYAVFAVGLTSTADLALLLTEAVFALGIPQRLCTIDSVLKNRWVRDSEVPDAFSTLERTLRQHREARNLYLHRGASLHPPVSIPAAEWRMLKLVSHGDRGTFAAESHAIEHVALAVHEEFQRLIESLLSILDALEPAYNQRIQKFIRPDQ